MRAHFILEGSDCTGKTTIANRLMNQGWRYHHEGVPPLDWPANQLFEYYAQLMIDAVEPTVFDRLYAGEVVYGSVMRGVSRFNADHLAMFDRIRRARGIITVLCGTSYRNCLNTWLKQTRDEYVKDEATYKKIWTAYRQLQFDYNVPEFTLPRYIADQQRPTLPRGYVGSPSAKVLIVGERAAGGLDLPFMSLTNSSGYLNACLKKASIKEVDLALVNAYDAKGKPVELFQFQTVIALGNEAAEACKKQGIHGRQISHPAFWKRFHFHETDRYVNMIRRAYAASR